MEISSGRVFASESAVFLSGVNDGIIPKSGGTGGIISDIDREFLQESEFELAPTPRQQMYIQRLYLYLMMTKPTEQLYLSYAKVDNEGKSIRPAYLINTVLRLFPELVVDQPQMRPMEEQMESPADTLSYLVELLRRYAAEDIGEERRFLSHFMTHMSEMSGMRLSWNRCAGQHFPICFMQIQTGFPESLRGFCMGRF